MGFVMERSVWTCKDSHPGSWSAGKGQHGVNSTKNRTKSHFCNSTSTWALFYQMIFIGPLISHTRHSARSNRKTQSWIPPLHGKRTSRRLGEYTLHHLCSTDTRIRLTSLAWWFIETAKPSFGAGASQRSTADLKSTMDNTIERTFRATPMAVPLLATVHCSDGPFLLHQLVQNPTDPLKDCLFPFSSTVPSYNFRKPRQLILPTTRTSQYLNSFFFHSALLWNSLPSSIQSITKPNHFRQALKSHWIEQKYQPFFSCSDGPTPFPSFFSFFKC